MGFCLGECCSYVRRWARDLGLEDNLVYLDARMSGLLCVAVVLMIWV
jgi:hypothetical protein